jgi:transcription antitermination factor NusG
MYAGWVVLKTQPRHEVLAVNAIDARGVETYLPLVKPKRASSSTVALFPGYVFARVGEMSDDVLRIRSAPGIAYLLPRDCSPALVPDGVIEMIRHRLTEEGHATGVPTLVAGDRVQLISGPFRWMDAVFDRRLSAAGRVRILLELAHRSVHVNVQESQLKRA